MSSPFPAPPTQRYAVIVATAVQLRVGARLLLGETSLRISEGDRIGLVGRNGAGKTTLTKTIQTMPRFVNGFLMQQVTGSQ